MEYVLIIVLIVGFGMMFAFLFNQFKRLEEKTSASSNNNEVLTQWLGSIKSTVETEMSAQRQTLLEQNKILGERLDNASRVVGEVQRELGKMSDLGKGIKDLQDVLLSPKARGTVGEEVLESLLAQVLPKETYEFQYTFRKGEKVDAIIKTDKGIIPIDSKFPLENFRLMISQESEEARESTRKVFIRDIKKHIGDISKKYILPAEGTIDFALMYMPSESIFYEVVVNNPDLELYARDRRVVFVSPNSFYCLLKIILIGIQQKDMAENAKKIWESLQSVKKETVKFGSELSVLDGHLNRSRSSMDNVMNKYNTFLGKVNALEAKGDEAVEKLLDSSEDTANLLNEPSDL